MNDKTVIWFNSLTESQNNLAKQLQNIIFEIAPELTEEIKWNMPNYSLNKLVCYLQKSKTHVTIGFQQGAHINDPNNWLQGTGKDMRHLKFALSDEIETEKVKFLLEQAVEYDQG